MLALMKKCKHQVVKRVDRNIGAVEDEMVFLCMECYEVIDQRPWDYLCFYFDADQNLVTSSTVVHLAFTS